MYWCLDAITLQPRPFGSLALDAFGVLCVMMNAKVLPYLLYCFCFVHGLAGGYIGLHEGLRLCGIGQFPGIGSYVVLFAIAIIRGLLPSMATFWLGYCIFDENIRPRLSLVIPVVLGVLSGIALVLCFFVEISLAVHPL